MDWCWPFRDCKFLNEKTSSHVTRECNLLEVLRRQKLVTRHEPIFTHFSTERVEAPKNFNGSTCWGR